MNLPEFPESAMKWAYTAHYLNMFWHFSFFPCLVLKGTVFIRILPQYILYHPWYTLFFSFLFFLVPKTLKNTRIDGEYWRGNEPGIYSFNLKIMAIYNSLLKFWSVKKVQFLCLYEAVGWDLVYGYVSFCICDALSKWWAGPWRIPSITDKGHMRSWEMLRFELVYFYFEIYVELFVLHDALQAHFFAPNFYISI